MTTQQCAEDPTLVACTGEDAGRQYDLPPEPVDVADTTVTVEVGTVDPAPVTTLATTGVPSGPYLAVALLLVAAGALLRRWAS